MTVDQFPVLKLNESSRAVLKGEEKIMVRRERIEVKDGKNRKSKSKRKTDFDFDEKLFDLLSEKRKELATSKKVPLYVIFANSVLEELAYAMPVKKDDFLNVKGIGEKKFETYGQAFISIIETYKTEQNIETNNSVEDLYEEVEVVSSDKGRYEQTLEIYNKGLTLEEIASQRGLTVTTIIKHLERLITDGFDVDIRQYIDPDKEAEIVSLLETHGTESVKAIKDQASETITYNDIHLVLSQY